MFLSKTKPATTNQKVQPFDHQPKRTCCSYKSISIALLIISMLVTGGILFHFKLNAIASFCLMGVGGFGIAAGLITIAISSLRRHRDQPSSEITYAPDDEIVSNQSPPSTFNTNKENISQRSLSSFSLTSNRDNAWQKEQRDRQFRDLYKEDQLFVERLLSLSSVDGSEVISLLLLSHEEFLSLPTKEIESYSSYKMRWVYDRLLYLEQYPSCLPDPVSTSSKTFSLEKLRSGVLTLAELRSMDTFHDATIHRGSGLYLGMLTTTQLSNIFGGPGPWLIPKENVPYFLPKNAYTYYRLQKIKPEFLNKHLIHVPVAIVRYLPLSCFSSPDFSWKHFASLDPTITLPTDHTCFNYFPETDAEFTRRVFSFKNKEMMSTIQSLAPNLSHKHLPLFPENVLLDEAFPWKAFINKKGIGAELRSLPSRIVAHAHLPWALLAQQPEAIASLLNLDSIRFSYQEEFDDQFTKNIFKELSIQNIQALAPALSCKHLLFFPENVLLTKDFPWETFINKEDLSKTLDFLPSKILAEAHLLWAILAKTPEVLGLVLDLNKNTRSDRHHFTVIILNTLAIESIKILAPHLTVSHLELFSDEKLQHKDFPWTVFLNKEGIAAKLHVLKIESLTHFPWTELLRFPNEVQVLLKGNSSFVRKILQQLDLNLFASYLNVDHLELLGKENIPTDFPWNKFPDSKGAQKFRT